MQYVTSCTEVPCMSLGFKQPTRWNNNKLLLIVTISSTYFGRLFRLSSGTLDCVYSLLYNARTILLAGDKDEVELFVLLCQWCKVKQTSNLSRWDSMWADPDDLRTSAIKWHLEVCRKDTEQKRDNPVAATSKTINIHYSQLIRNSVLNMTYKPAGTLDACAIGNRKFQLRSRHGQIGHCIWGQWPAFSKRGHRRSASVGSTLKSD